MSCLIKVQIFILFIGLIPSSHAFSVKEGWDYFQKEVQLCREGFLKKVRGSDTGKDRVHSLMRRMDRALVDKEGWLRGKTPALLKELYEFRAQTEALLTQRISVSESLNIQTELEGLVLSYAFWGITQDIEILGKATFVSLKDSERDSKKNFQEWAEAQMGRELIEKEVRALEEVYNYSITDRWDMRYRQLSWDLMVAERHFFKKNILKEAGFSEEEIEKLGWKKVLRGKRTIEVKIPPRVREEARLRKQEFNTAYTRGADEWEEWMAVTEQLRETEMNPYEDHVPYFAKKLREYMAYMERGIKTSWQREQFELLKSYTELIIREEGVTYVQFLAVSLRVPDILSNEDRPGTAHPFVAQEQASKFPQKMAVPITVGELGFIPLNKGEGPEVSPIALVTSTRMIDGSERNPIAVAYHDENHIELKPGTEKWFHEELMKRKENLPFERRRNIELAYHILVYEIIYKKGTFIDNQEGMEEDIENGLHALIRNGERDERGLRGVIPLSGYFDPYIQVVIGDFRRIFDEIQKEAVQH